MITVEIEYGEWLREQQEREEGSIPLKSALHGTQAPLASKQKDM